jgi:hypothetical protein
MLRFSIKALAVFTAIIASYLAVLQAAARGGPGWTTFLAFTMYAGLIIGWCVYCDTRDDKQR